MKKKMAAKKRAAMGDASASSGAKSIFQKLTRKSLFVFGPLHPIAVPVPVCKYCDCVIHDLCQIQSCGVLTLAVVSLELQQMTIHENLNELDSNYTKIIRNVNDTAMAAVDNSSEQSQKRHDLLSRRLENATASLTVLNRTVVNLTRRMDAFSKRMGEMHQVVEKIKNQKEIWLAPPVHDVRD